MQRLKVGLFGCGTVGSGVYRILTEQRERIVREAGVDIEIVRVCVKHPAKRRAVELPREIVTTDAAAILDDESIDVVIEVIGGEREALSIIELALERGRHVVTANKDVVARHLPELRRLEDEHGGHLFYGASVCGSVPILKIIDETLLADRVEGIRGVVNGSTNFILTRLADGWSYDEALSLAESNGFLEADPSADLSGADAARKLSILAFHAFGVHVPPERVETCGIEFVSAGDLARAAAADSTIKLVAEARFENERLVLSVAPRAVPLDSPLASVRDEVNIVELDCEGIGTQRFIGKGAGSYPTANAVVSDILDIVARRRYRRWATPAELVAA
jgi:homoserine dehydrogenase